jgi:drug/metabolite transporter (DMT)-like permease
MTSAIFLTGAAMLCFAANSLLCRLALGPNLIDAATFTGVRVASAAVLQTIAVYLRHHRLPISRRANPRSIVSLFAYLVFFSFAYTRLSAGTGALVLIGGVQLTMFFTAWREGESFPALAWVGLGLALLGVIYLLLPGVHAPDPLGAAFMVISGAAWGIFSLIARGAGDPVETNASNLLWCLLPAALLSLVCVDDFKGTTMGFGLAIASGAIATGVGYIVWYLALRHLTAGHAAAVQLSMPALTALGGVAFLAEPLTWRLVLASAAMLGGISLVLSQRPRARR